MNQWQNTKASILQLTSWLSDSFIDIRTGDLTRIRKQLWCCIFTAKNYQKDFNENY